MRQSTSFQAKANASGGCDCVKKSVLQGAQLARVPEAAELGVVIQVEACLHATTAALAVNGRPPRRLILNKLACGVRLCGRKNGSSSSPDSKELKELNHLRPVYLEAVVGPARSMQSRRVVDRPVQSVIASERLAVSLRIRMNLSMCTQWRPPA